MKKLKEGFMGYTVKESDTAADFVSNIDQKIKPIIIQESNYSGDEFNTNGPTNIAMAIVEGYLPSRYLETKIQTYLIQMLRVYFNKLDPDIHDEYDIVRRAIRMLSGKYTVKVI